jgi:hypothetical protein
MEDSCQSNVCRRAGSIPVQEEFYRKAADVQFSVLKSRCTVMKRGPPPPSLPNTTDIFFMNIQYIEVVFGGPKDCFA